MRIVSQAKTAWIPAEFPVVAINQVRDGPDQRLFPHRTGKVGRVARKRDFVSKSVFITVGELLDPGIHR